MRFHQLSEFESFNQTRMQTENLWNSFVERHQSEGRNRPTNQEEIVYLIHKMQEYVAFDFPYEARGADRDDKNLRDVLSAFDDMCRIAYMLAEGDLYKHTDYFNKKYYNALIALDYTKTILEDQ